MIRPEPLPSEAWHHALASASIGSFALACPAPHRRAARRLARQLLEEAAAQGGGQVVSLPSAELLLGAAANAARRAARALAELLGEATATLHSLPEQAAALRDWVAGLPRSPASQDGEPPLALRARVLLDGAGQPRGQFLGPVDATLDHAARKALCRRIMAALTDPAQRSLLPALRPGLRLFLACPAGHQASLGPRGRRPDDEAAPVAVLPLTVLLPPQDFAARAEALREAGWQAGLAGNDPAALDWMPRGAIWHVAPAGPTPPSVLHDHLILLGERPGWAPPRALHAA